MVLIVRHPGAVIESELRGHWEATRVLDKFRNDAQLHVLTRDRYRSVLSRQLSPIEALATRWVIENQLAIQQAIQLGVTVVYYERLKSVPDKEWVRVCQALGLKAVPSASVRARPSQQSASREFRPSIGASAEPRWVRGLTGEQCNLIQRILDEAEFDIYSMKSNEPRDSGGNGTAPLALVRAR